VTIEGSILDEKGEPVIGAVICVWERSPGFHHRRPIPADGFLAGAATDINGRFTVSPLAPRDALWVTAEACCCSLPRPLRIEANHPCGVHMRIHLCWSKECLGTMDGAPLIDYRSTSD